MRKALYPHAKDLISRCRDELVASHVMLVVGCAKPTFADALVMGTRSPHDNEGVQ